LLKSLVAEVKVRDRRHLGIVIDADDHPEER